MNADALYLAIIKEGSDYTAIYSIDGVNYFNVGTITTETLGVPRLGLFAMNGNRLPPDIPADFDYFVITDSTIEVTIDIKPGNANPNCFKINSHGVIPVAIFGSEDFDVSQIDPQTLLFGGLKVRIRGNKGPLCAIEYSNDDMYLDMVCHFEDDASMWKCRN